MLSSNVRGLSNFKKRRAIFAWCRTGIDHSSVRNRGNTEAKTRTKTKTPTSSKGSQVHIPLFGWRNVALRLIHNGESGKLLKK